MATKELGVLGKEELSEALRDRCPGQLVSKAAASQVASAVIEILGDAIASGRDVALVGFGKFKVKQRAAREGRNPLTGEPLKIAASKNVSFKLGAPLKARLNKGRR